MGGAGRKAKVKSVKEAFLRDGAAHFISVCSCPDRQLRDISFYRGTSLATSINLLQQVLSKLVIVYRKEHFLFSGNSCSPFQASTIDLQVYKCGMSMSYMALYLMS